MKTTARTCSVCRQEAELRPYGEGGAFVCFPCGMKDEATAGDQFAKRLAAAESVTGISLLTPEGPIPYIGPLSRP